MNRITRRTALATGGRAALATGAVAVLATPLNAAAATDPGDAGLVDLERQWHELITELVDLEDAKETAKAAMPEWARPGQDIPEWLRPSLAAPGCGARGFPAIDPDLPMFANAYSVVYHLRPSLDDIQRLNRVGKIHAKVLARSADNPRIIADELARGQERIDYWHEFQHAKRECERGVGVTAIEARMDDVVRRISEVEHEILRTRARSIEGVAVKLRVFVDVMGKTGRASTDPDLSFDEQTVISVLEDLERLGAA